MVVVNTLRCTVTNLKEEEEVEEVEGGAGAF